MVNSKPSKVRVKHNIWGNYNCFVGRERVNKYGSSFEALVWLAGQIKAGAEVSAASDLSAKEASSYLRFVD